MENTMYADVSIPNVVEVSVSFDNPLGYPESDDRTFVEIKCLPESGNAHLNQISRLKSYIGRMGDILTYEFNNNLMQIPYTKITNIETVQRYDGITCSLYFYSSNKPEIVGQIDSPEISKEEHVEKPKKSTLGSRIIELD